ncbi:MAG: hypothetical protein UX99_C0007G0022 [Candidatus Amesbacteria bacterium GW2011_GWB1_47_26]|uniref:Type 4 fimbrial biogenesis protein PilX N-terminal domain-containing protein n=1 Tax=Candidatus Amesbacteria bacterium GW2011_GWC2_45_19 TaxID=1618366 RepID=A0A0G1Q1H1_9BACT|nr:MAG: hypothetical protein UX05_C0012G0002 [Candidatus Amesbacteria bacterium GW2011_GWC2_45_19]KKU69048.1 MAG: hypothetical protein UX93_C0003G0040 [Microgenomates group bacterium GW2011_GWC1_47_20]KKU74734.1 MAG: hypothetical protein UX99_C0007G0022 [Candidatus Amesbacteria bacterium GW2011_GWB1_47_26]
MILRLRSGQTLVVLLVFIAMAMAVVSAAVAVVISNTQSGSRYELGQTALGLGESGVEEALLMLLRNPNYAGGTLTTVDGTATISVSGSDPKTIVSSAAVGEIRRKIQVVASYTAGILTVQTWREIE